MKNLILMLAVVLMFASCTNVDPTEVGFKINNSGDYRGIDSLPTVTGWNFYSPGFSRIVTLPTVQQHVVWTSSMNEGKAVDESIAIACQGGSGFSINVGLNYRVNPSKASKIYLKYKTSDLESITQTYLRNIVRGSMQDVSGTITVDSILNNLPAYEHAVRDLITNRLSSEGFTVDNFSILNQPTPTDPNLQKSIAAKIQAKQDAETSKMQLQIAIAEANKKAATARGDSAEKVINAMGEAEAVKKIQQVLSPTYVSYIQAQRWDGKLSQVVSGNGGGILFQMKQ